MQLRMTLIVLALMAVSSAAWTAPAHSGASSSLFAGIFSESAGFLARIAHTMTEPVGLLLMGIGLIALSIVVRRRVFGRRIR